MFDTPDTPNVAFVKIEDMSKENLISLQWEIASTIRKRRIDALYASVKKINTPSLQHSLQYEPLTKRVLALYDQLIRELQPQFNRHPFIDDILDQVEVLIELTD